MLVRKLGKLQFDHPKKAVDPFDKTAIASMKGLIGFKIRFSDATSQLDPWDGSRFTGEHLMTVDYWTAATHIWLRPTK